MKNKEEGILDLIDQLFYIILIQQNELIQGRILPPHEMKFILEQTLLAFLSFLFELKFLLMFMVLQACSTLLNAFVLDRLRGDTTSARSAT